MKLRANMEMRTTGGSKDRTTNWVQVAVEADSIANVPTIVPAVYISLCSRDCEEEVIVAGKDLCNAIGFLTPVQQKQQAAKGGIDDSWLQADKSKRTYVLSKETKEKIASNQALYSKAVKVQPQGSMYVGARAMANTKLVQWIK